MGLLAPFTGIAHSEFDAQMHKMIMRYPEQVSLVQMNFLDTHDVPRFLSYCVGDRRRLRLAYFYLFMGYGVPSVFYGDEYYIEGETENAYRSPMPWGSEDNCYDILREYAQIRREHSAIRNGTYRTVLCQDEKGLYLFLRENEQEKILIALNNSDEEQEISDKAWRIPPMQGDIRIL